MQRFSTFVTFEKKRILCKRNVIIFLLYILVLLVSLNSGITEYYSQKEKIKNFQELENLEFSKIYNYELYSIHGLNLKFVPSISSIFFNRSNISWNLYGKINPVTKVSVDLNYRSNSFFREELHYIQGFSRLLLIFGSLLLLFLGYETFPSDELTRFYSNISSPKIHFSFTIAARLVVLSTMYLGLLSTVGLFLYLKGIRLLSEWNIIILKYFVASFIVLVFFFLMGVIVGFFRSKPLSFITLISVWTIFIFIIPSFGNSNTLVLIQDIPNSIEIDWQKANIVTEFEKKCIEKAGKFDRNNIEVEQQMIEGYWNDEYKKIEALEEKIKKAIQKNLDKYETFAILTPTTFYFLTEHEASSVGFENLLLFYSYIHKKQKEFARFYIDRCFYNDPKVIVPFIKNDENIFYAESRLPGSFKTGLVLNLFYLVILVGLAYFRFFQYIYGVPDSKMPELSELNPQLKPGQILGIVTEEDVLKTQIFRLWSGKFGKCEKVVAKVGEEDVFDPKYKNKGFDFLYICHAKDLPEDIKTKDFVRFIMDIQGASQKDRSRLYLELELDLHENKKLGELKKSVRAKILLGLALLKDARAVIMNDIGLAMTIDFLDYLKDGLYKLMDNNAAIMYMSEDMQMITKISDFVSVLLNDRVVQKIYEGETDRMKFDR